MPGSHFQECYRLVLLIAAEAVVPGEEEGEGYQHQQGHELPDISQPVSNKPSMSTQTIH